MIPCVPLLKEAVYPDDDWIRIRDVKARRKVQNRLNQRAVRRRKNPEKTTHLQSKIEDVQRGHQSSHIKSSVDPNPQPTTKSPPPTTPSPQTHLNLSIIVHPHHRLAPSIIQASSSSSAHRTPQIILPLSSDHLINLVAHNLYRALLTNMLLIGTPNLFTCSLTTTHGNLITPLPLPSPVPPSLYPTTLQRGTAHPPWIDIFPVAAARDVLIQELGSFNEEELYEDVLPAFAAAKGIATGGSAVARGGGTHLEDEEQRGVIIWGDPWVAASWEMTPFFMMKWGWMFRDCVDEVLRCTNHWRRMRGEEPLEREGVASRDRH